MSTIQKKWGEVINAYNIAATIAQNADNQLEAIKKLEKQDKSKDELKAQLEENAKNKPLFTELSRIYKLTVNHLQKLADLHNESATEINIDNALEAEVTPAKDGKPAVMKLVLDENGNYCYDRAAEKAKTKAFKELNESNIMVPQLEIATTLTDKISVFEGILIFTKLVEKTRTTPKPVRKK